MLSLRIILSLLLLLLVEQSLANNATKCPYRCHSGECINLDLLCDGIAHCMDASDETVKLCNNIWCPGYSFRCNYGACISSTNVCDGKMDCVDGSDEQKWLCRAQMLQGNCDNWELRCASGKCLPYSSVCDGKYDCLDGDDEADTLCEGAPTTSTSTASTSIDVITKSTTPLTLAMRKLINTTMDESYCVVPLLPNIILKNGNDAVLQAGGRVHNGTHIHFGCPTEHALIGEHENWCQAPRWMHEFPYCETPTTSFIFIVTIALFCVVMLGFIFIYIRGRKTGGQRSEDRFWLVETNNFPSTPTVTFRARNE